MTERKKLELQLNQPSTIELLFDRCHVGQSSYGEYYLYAVRNGDGSTEYSFFAPPEVHEQLKSLKKGDKAKILKLAEQTGSKIETKYDIQLYPVAQKVSTNDTVTTGSDSYFSAMLSSYEDAIRIQEKLNGMVDVNRIAITLFIARSKVNGNGFNGG